MKIMKKFVALIMGFIMMSSSIAFAAESTKSHLSAFDGVPSEIAQQNDLDAVSGELIPVIIAGALLAGGAWYYGSKAISWLKANNTYTLANQKKLGCGTSKFQMKCN